MLALARRVMAFEMTVAEWIGTGVLLGVPAVVLVAVVAWLSLPGMCPA